MAMQWLYKDTRNTDDLSGGSGSGAFGRGPRISSMSEIAVGDLLVDDSDRFAATKVLRIVKCLRDDLVYGQFVNPKDPTRRRLGDDRPFAIWDFHFGLPHERYYRALPR